MRTLLLFLACFPSLALAQSTVLEGTVRDGAGQPMPFANVQLAGTLDGAATDADGRFQFATRQTGPQELMASMMGFETAAQSVDLVPGDTLRFELVLLETLISLDEAVVTANGYTTGESEVATLSTLEVVTTAGAAADILLAIKAFPGVSSVDEGSGLFVRGGDVAETVVMLDQATVTHPYKFESPTGGAFGTIPPFLVKGTSFSTGGFSAKYGNALSGVLSMESLDAPTERQATASASLAAVSASGAIPIAPGLGLRFSGNRSFTDLLFRVNRTNDTFITTPRGTDGNVSLIYDYSDTGRLKLFGFLTTDRLGVQVDEPSFVGLYRGETTSGFYNLQWTETLRGWQTQTSLSLARAASNRRFGLMDFTSTDRTAKLRTDADRPLSDKVLLSTGFEVNQLGVAFDGTIPTSSDLLDPNAPSYQLDERYTGIHTGAYTEATFQPNRRWVLTAGLRTDYHSLANEQVVDPRVSVRYWLDKHTSLRAAAGLYHQFATAYQYDATAGNPDLTSQKATHLVAGVEHERGMTLFRTEAYLKPYSRLLLDHPTLNWTNDGRGYARGVDVFLKHGAFLRTRVSGWVSYSFLQSERRQSRQQAGVWTYEDAPSPFDITHNLTVVGKVRVVGFLNVGIMLRSASGRPITPINGGVLAEGADYYLPLEGAIGSDRLPSFHRADLQISYYYPFGRHNAVFYLSASNVLNRANVTGYTYNQDYTERTAERTNYRRLLYFGATVTLF
ncbi:MAG: TonB-dependent receptor [Bacteroidota bacterium]